LNASSQSLHGGASSVENSNSSTSQSSKRLDETNYWFNKNLLNREGYPISYRNGGSSRNAIAGKKGKKEKKIYGKMTLSEVFTRAGDK